MGKRILLVEDEPETRGDIQTVLSSHGYEVLETDLAGTAWHLFVRQKPDLVILDLGLPDASGIDVCRKIRCHKELRLVPVIMLTGKSQFETKAEGFEAGADQYLVKPVPPRELLLWVQALLRRLEHTEKDGDVLQTRECEIDLKAHMVRFRDLTISNLTRKEFELLYFLVKKRPKVLSRRYILSHLWHTIATDHVVDTHLTNLRKKLPRELSNRIQAVPGKGVRFLE